MSKRNPSVLGVWGPDGKRVVASLATWRQPLKWNRQAEKAGERRRVFCASMADVFEDRPELTLARCRLLRLIHLTPHLDWLLLTKRPEGIMDRLQECSSQEDKDHGDDGKLGINDGACLASQWKHGSPMPNIWLGVSVENQQCADERIPLLLQTPARVRFLSCEPLLGPINLHFGQRDEGQQWERHLEIQWVIAGGESGRKARACDLSWIRSLVEQCRTAGVACFVKQTGSRVILPPGDAIRMCNSGANMDRRSDSKGGNPDDWSSDLRVRQFPEVSHV